jgi:hypothetical protein
MERQRTVSIAGQNLRWRSWSIASGPRQLEVGPGIGSDQTLKVCGNETSNIEGRVRGECRAFNRWDEAAGEMAHWKEGIGRGQRDRARGPSGRIGENPMTPSKAQLIRKEGPEHLSHS